MKFSPGDLLAVDKRVISTFIGSPDAVAVFDPVSSKYMGSMTLTDVGLCVSAHLDMYVMLMVSNGLCGLVFTNGLKRV